MNIDKIRKDFFILDSKNPPIYFDNACTTLKPVQVLDKMDDYYELYPSCGGRSQHRLGTQVTEEVHKSRKTIADFFNAKRSHEIIFTRNTTEGINLIANSLHWNTEPVVLCSDKEHNSNLIPWLVAKKRGIRHEIFKFDDIEDFKSKIKGVKLVSIVHTSNVDGTSNDIKELTKIAHDHGALMLLDAAQSAPHKELNVKRLDIDFMACSGHKMLGPSGTGILYGKTEELEKLKPFMVGGDTVTNSTYDSYEPENVPERFEAGLQNYSGMLGFAEATKYLSKIGLSDIEKHEIALNERLSTAFAQMGVHVLGPADAHRRSGVCSFNVKGVPAHDVALMLNSHNIMIRSGMHCVHSWFNANKIEGSARASFYLYNTEEEVDEMIKRMEQIVKVG